MFCFLFTLIRIHDFNSVIIVHCHTFTSGDGKLTYGAPESPKPVYFCEKLLDFVDQDLKMFLFICPHILFGRELRFPNIKINSGHIRHPMAQFLRLFTRHHILPTR